MVVATPSTGRKIVKETAEVLTHNTKWRIRLVTSVTKQKKRFARSRRRVMTVMNLIYSWITRMAISNVKPLTHRFCWPLDLASLEGEVGKVCLWEELKQLRRECFCTCHAQISASWVSFSFTYINGNSEISIQNRLSKRLERWNWSSTP